MKQSSFLSGIAALLPLSEFRHFAPPPPAKFNRSRVRFHLAASLMFFIMFLNAQEEQTFCTTQNTNRVLDIGDISHLNTTGPYYIRIYVNVIQDANGNGGQTPEQVREAINFLHQDFKVHNIFFVWDCHINYIKNQTYFEAVQGDTKVLKESTGADDDGIRIYLFPDHPWPIASGRGDASGIGGGALLVSGNYFFSPYSSLVRSHVLSHEMGHCLGLWHTDVGAQIANDPNCTYPGDFVCDTPPDPGMAHQVSFPSCEFQVPVWDPISEAGSVIL
ncbi:MAG: hypothetical protein KF734_20270 [Saprospiraceae bacterium]|nr:hypothetical protein [Saprospiraceae bacterium]